jgi:peroxiredoxin
VAVTQRTITLGTQAPDFTLQSTEGETISLADFEDAQALLVAFACQHCPYVQHIEDQLGALTAELSARGLATVAICSNDTTSHPTDAPEYLEQQRQRAAWAFPYLVDADQRVALEYGAACTPDLFLFDSERKLAYHGAFDNSRPGNGVPVTGELLRDAVERVLAGQPVPEPHVPCMGCGIKWLAGNEPTL